MSDLDHFRSGYLYARVRIPECILHTRPRVPAGARHSLRPLDFRGQTPASLRRSAPRDRESISTSLRGANATTQSMSPHAARRIASLRSQWLGGAAAWQLL